MSKKLRIGFLMQGSHSWPAGFEYTKNIILALNCLPSEQRDGFEICFICDKEVDPSLYEQVVEHVDITLYKDDFILSTFLKTNIGWNILKFLFFRFHSINFVYPDINYLPFLKLYRSATWIPDFQYKHYPFFFSAQNLRKVDKQLSKVTSFAECILMMSKTAEVDLLKFFPNSKGKSHVLTMKIYPDPAWYSENPSKVLEKYHLPERFFLVSNRFWQHKNHSIVLRSLSLLSQVNLYPKIVFTGHLYDNRNPEYSDQILQTIHQLDVADQVFLLGVVPKFEQVQMLRTSLAVIQPSLFEGQGLIIEESRCFGKKVLLSDIPVHREQESSDCLFFDPESSQELSELVGKLWLEFEHGLDLEAEKIAKQKALEEAAILANRFLSLVKT